jgi:hypothetical protein
LEGQRAGTVKGSRGRPRGNQGKTLATVSYEAEVAEISATFQRKLAGLRRRLPSWEIPAAVRALKEEKQAALKALRDRRAAEQHGKRENQRRLRPPPGSQPR